MSVPRGPLRAEIGADATADMHVIDLTDLLYVHVPSAGSPTFCKPRLTIVRDKVLPISYCWSCTACGATARKRTDTSAGDVHLYNVLLQVVDGIQLTAHYVEQSLGMDGLMHVTVAAVKGLENRGRDLCSHTGQRLSMATAVFNALRLSEPWPASTRLFQVPAEEVIAHMWRHTLFQCEAFFPTVLRVVQRPIAVAAPSKRKPMSAVESTASAPKKRRSSGPQIADSNIPTLTVAGVHIVCRNNLHGTAARQLQSMPMTLWESLAAELLCPACGRQTVKARLSVVNREHNISSKCGWCSCSQKCTDARIVRSFEKILRCCRLHLLLVFGPMMSRSAKKSST